MKYSINKLAKLAGITTRTLRYYDEIGLLRPTRISANGYRTYAQGEVDLLQQILFYRELGLPLDEIKNILWSRSYDRLDALNGHLTALKAKKERIELLIVNVENTIGAMKGELTMSDKEKFEGFKRKAIEDNEARYGVEIREKFGDSVIDASNARMMSLTKEQFEHEQRLSQQINVSLRAAFEQGDPSGKLAQQVCALHKEWLKIFWPNYSKEAHLALSQAYVADPRLKEYYDSIEEGCAQFLRDSIEVFFTRT